MASTDPQPSSTRSEPRAYANQWDLFALYCRDFHAAARYAARRDWWLHCWQWRTDADAPEEPQVIVLRSPDPHHPSTPSAAPTDPIPLGSRSL